MTYLFWVGMAIGALVIFFLWMVWPLAVDWWQARAKFSCNGCGIRCLERHGSTRVAIDLSVVSEIDAPEIVLPVNLKFCRNCIPKYAQAVN